MVTQGVDCRREALARLVDIFQSIPAELVDLNVGFAGKLSDGSPACQQVRDYLAAVPSHLLTRYAEECLTTKSTHIVDLVFSTAEEVSEETVTETTDGEEDACGRASRCSLRGLPEVRERGSAVSFFFSFRSHQRKPLESARHDYVGPGCGSEQQVLLIPFDRFEAWLGHEPRRTRGW